MLLSWKIILISIAGALALSAGTYFYGRWDGSSACNTRHATAQVKENAKVKKRDAKIDKATPFDSDKRTTLDWLYNYGRQQ